MSMQGGRRGNYFILLELFADISFHGSYGDSGVKGEPFRGACSGFGRAKFGQGPFDSLISIVRWTARMICNGSLN